MGPPGRHAGPEVSEAAKQVHIAYLNAADVATLALTDDEILNAVEDGLRAQGSGQTVIENDNPRL